MGMPSTGGVNDELPSDINVIELVRAPQRFHARHDAVARSYLYQIARRRTAFAKPFVWWVREDLDVARMREGAARFVGLKDFQSFTAEAREDASTKVQVDTVEIIDAPPLLLVRIVGSHFLWKMVRRLVGVLVAVGRHELKVADVERMLTEASDEAAPLTAPASGLFLERVFYAGDERQPPLVPIFSPAAPPALNGAASRRTPCRRRGRNATRSAPSACGAPPSENSSS